YHGTGDSPGDDLDPDRLNCWVQNIKAAITEAKTLSGCSQVCLIGLRMGATLAALAASEVEVPYLVLWHPCVNGRHYVREMQALALLSDSGGEQPKPAADGVIESAGFVMSTETAEQLKKVNLLKLKLQVQQALIIERDDLAEDAAFATKLQEDNIATTYLTVPGYAEMMAEPQFTSVPDIAIDKITGWLKSKLNEETRFTAPALNGSRQPQEIEKTSCLRFSYKPEGVEGHGTVELTEQPCDFGSGGKLFGILTYLHQPTTDKPSIVMLNAGSVHHVGPNRLYVALARTLAANGYPCFRMDIAGVGDSIIADSANENHPYPATAVRDADEALRYLTEHFSCQQFVVMGLCSGAHTAFHAGIELADHNIVESILINPLTFQWEEGMSLETTPSTQHFQDVAYYKQSARSIKSWKKLLKGQVNVVYLTGVGLAQVKVMIKSRRDAFIERIRKQSSTKLSSDLKRYFQLQRPLSLFIASTDPGYDILLAGARGVAQRGIKEKKIKVQFITDADHTFTQHQKRRDLISRLCTHLNGKGS
ncbi:MAG: alpha/beta hydrolase, partial [Abitibacteriaceae bacterium]|nr:alpha/beta hydrolase [Abditibacteriaceae bacterium]